MSRRIFPSLVSFLLASFAMASAQVQFTSQGYSSGDYDSEWIVNGDFNNDGIPDLITFNAGSYSYFKGIGGGKFATPVMHAANIYEGPAAAADFNQDGKLDLAVICGNCDFKGYHIFVLLGNGNGTFASGTLLSTANVPFFLTLADFNGDHLPDIAVSECAAQSDVCSAEVFLGQGNGTFKLSATLPYGGGQLVAGDFNADGHQDIAVITGQSASGELAVFLGNGNGTFQSPKLASFSDPVSLAVGDFYNNRIQSLAVLTYISNGGYGVTTARYVNGTIFVGSPYLVTTGANYYYLTAGDLNGDFLEDVVLVGQDDGNSYTSSNGATTYLLGSGNGSFQAPVNLAGYGQTEVYPFIRDLNLDSRHDIGTVWDDPDSRFGSGGGAFVLINTNATFNCDPTPANALSVRVCAPSNGQTVGTSVVFRGAANALNGVVKRMELWVDGKKVGENLEDQLKITATVAAGTHTASIVAVDSFDNHASNSVSFTVK